ncbi:MAG: urease accessory UreF family protein [Pseudomonadota bacterium]
MATTATTRSTTIHTTTLTDADLLGLVWLASPALPVGGFSYSEVLEAAVEGGLVTDEGTAANWLADQLHLTLARGDLAVLAAAVTAWREADLARIAQLNDWVLHTRETSELRQQTEQMGRSMVEWLRSIKPETTPAHWTYPIAFALASSAGTASPRAIALAFAFGWAENMIQAAIKSIPLGQSSGQRILSRLAGEIPAAVDHALALPDDAWQAFSPMLAILSAQHETQYSRLFRS